MVQKPITGRFHHTTPLGLRIGFGDDAMKLGILVESGGETRVAIVPNSVSKLIKLGFEVLVESGSGDSAHHPD